MKLSTNLVVDDLRDIKDPAKRIEQMGFESLYVSERKHDPFLQLAIAACETERLKIGPEIALVFPRNPMVLAYSSWDLQRASKGRFILGLGTQVKAHNERRFGLEWERPGPKFKEYIQCIRHIWDCWQNGTEMNFEGEWFNINLMTPMFNPGPLECGPPPIYVGAVNPWNCRMAGEVADGFHCHGFHTAKTLKANVIDNIQQGLDNVGKDRKDFTITAPVMAVMGSNDKEIDEMRERVRGMIGFYGATKHYKSMFEAHDWEDTFDRLLEKSRTGKWDDMAAEITDEMIDAFAVTGYYEDIPELLEKKYDGMLDEVLIYFGEPEKGDPETWQRLIQAFKDNEKT